MTERWRKPVIPISIEESTDQIKIEDGREYCHYEYSLRPEDVERIRLGYVCANTPCFEPHPEPFPEHCTVCGFPMRELQLIRFAREFVGDRWVGSRETLEDEFARMTEDHARAKHAPGSSIWVPGVSDSAP